ncbi:Antitoxin YokJ [Bacillus siamensis]|nr:Antitoxin YokJ [Bacillus siamensis]
MLIKKIASTPDCRLFEADGLPTIDEKHDCQKILGNFMNNVVEQFYMKMRIIKYI